MPASRPASSTWSWAPARRSARRCRTTPASTASSSRARTRSGCGCSTRSAGPGRDRASWRWAARTRRSSRATPTSRRRPRGSCAASFGFGGQKCSANSRVYVERPVHDELIRLLVEKTESITVGDPLVRANWLGPVIDQRGRRPAPDRGRRGAPRRDGLHRRRAAVRRRPGARLLRRADRGRRPAGVAPAVPRRAVRAVHRGPRRGLARRGDHPRERLGPAG